MRNSFFKIISSLFRLFVAFASALFGVFSVALLLFSLTANGTQVRPGSEPFPDDSFTKFIEGLTATTNIQLLDAQGLTKGSANFEPWSGSYWPIHKGILAARYSSSTFANSKKFNENYESFTSHPAQNFLYSDRIKELSPAEKYDLLVGDANWTLTQHMWSRGLEDFQKDGFVAGWTGICHGWSAVTHMNPVAPYAPVTVQDVTGQYSITFHANDIKGLLSWLWASSAPSSYRAGNRCKQGSVEKDPYLRPVDPTCLDSNPMSWHLAITNKVGVYKKSMVMDSSNGPEVWNYPITGYDYSYFDPKTFSTTHSLNSAIRPVSQLTADAYKDFRSPRTKYIVGIIMDTFHPALTVPTTGVTNRITTRRHTFIYDLELDEAFNIVGGEWYGKETPDFIWSFPDGSRAQAREDVRLRSNEIFWNVRNSQISKEVAAMAREASKRGDILATITESLLQASTKTPDAAQPSPDEGVADEDEIDSGDPEHPNDD